MPTEHPTLVACLWLPSASDKEGSLQAIAESCVRFSPVIALREGEAVFVEVGKDWRYHSPESGVGS